MPSVDAQKAGSVLFLDDQGWDSFDQVAVALRRRGVRTARITCAPPARLRRLLREPHFRWLADRLSYDEVIDLSAADGLARLQRLLDRGEVFDVVVNEPALLAVGLESPIGEALTARALAFHGTPPQTLLDKFAVNEALARAGIDTPRQLSTRDVTPAEAVHELGLPLMIKHPIGASGERVRVARSHGEIATRLTELGGDEALFYQEHVTGKVVVYGAVVGPEGALIEHGFRVERPRSEHGPAMEATLHDRPELLAAGRKATALFGPRGFVSFGFIEQADGRLLHIDANIRPWGMIAAPLGLGIDFAAAYAALLGGTTPRVRATRQSPPSSLPVYPYRVFAPAEAGRVGDSLAGVAGLVRTCAGSLGMLYCGYVVGRALLLSVRGLRAARRPAAAETGVSAVAPAAIGGGAASSTPA